MLGEDHSSRAERIDRKLARQREICEKLEGDQVKLTRSEILAPGRSQGMWDVCTRFGVIPIYRESAYTTAAGSEWWRVNPHTFDQELHLFIKRHSLHLARVRTRAEVIQIIREALRRESE